MRSVAKDMLMQPLRLWFTWATTNGKRRTRIQLGLPFEATRPMWKSPHCCVRLNPNQELLHGHEGKTIRSLFFPLCFNLRSGCLGITILFSFYATQPSLFSLILILALYEF